VIKSRLSKGAIGIEALTDYLSRRCVALIKAKHQKKGSLPHTVSVCVDFLLKHETPDVETSAEEQESRLAERRNQCIRDLCYLTALNFNKRSIDYLTRKGPKDAAAHLWKGSTDVFSALAYWGRDDLIDIAVVVA